MSWCRWGSPCTSTIPRYEVDEACVKAGCPGSTVYVYEGERLTCCACQLAPRDEEGCSTDFECETEEEMLAHLLEHDRAGHHVRRSLLEEAHGREPRPTEDWRELFGV